MSHSRPLFLYCRILDTVDSNQMLLITGFKLRTSGVGSNRFIPITAPFITSLWVVFFGNYLSTNASIRNGATIKDAFFTGKTALLIATLPVGFMKRFDIMVTNG